MLDHRRHSWVKALLYTVCVMLLAGMVVMPTGGSALAENEWVLSSGVGQLPRVTWNGKNYRMKAELTTLLLIGYDRDPDAAWEGCRDGGQSDFLHLLVVDHRDKKIHQLQIDRDTITPITALTVAGQVYGKQKSQICLSHSFGWNAEECNNYAVEAVSNFLKGMPIDGYVSMSMYRIGDVNHVLGGVTVTIEDDLREFYPEMAPGAVITLTDEQARFFVRGRMGVSDGKNVSRMRRQREFIRSASRTLMNNLRESSGYAAKIFDDVTDIIESNWSSAKMINLMNRAAKYELCDVVTLSSRHEVVNDYVECYVNDQDVIDWVLKTFFDEVN